MSYALFMEVSKGTNDFLQKASSFLDCKYLFVVLKIKERASAEILQNKADMVFFFIEPIELNNVWVIQLAM